MKIFHSVSSGQHKTWDPGKHETLGLGGVSLGGFGREMFGVLQADLFAFASPLFLGVWRLYKVVHPARLTWNLQITHLEGKNDLPNLHDHVPCYSSGVYFVTRVNFEVIQLS